MFIRIQKILAHNGYGSRRDIESLIKQGNIIVNGKKAELGQKICNRDHVSINSKPVVFSMKKTNECKMLAYYKPVGEVCTRRDEQGRDTIFERIPDIHKKRWVNIGRLDINTTGLLLFTTNGDLANKLMHPSSQIEREYAVRVLGRPTKVQIEAMLNGVRLEDGLAKFKSIVASNGKGVNCWYHVVITEGRNREIRRILESQGLVVSRLIRIRFGSYSLQRNRYPSQYWRLNKKEIEALENSINCNSK